MNKHCSTIVSVEKMLEKVAFGRRVRENGAHVGLGAPSVVADHLATAQVADLEAEMAVSFIGLVEGRVAE